ncbi:hypothetical protein AB0L64_00515 [Kribbella sp. NPDC051936]|uniref:hypothetical protein n=1 Tax=Kribbella sp. NPDC051936 TaxID=3154946 RepID=UPI003420C60A
MGIVEFTPEPADFAWTFGGVPPVRRARPGTALRVWTEDTFAGSLRSTTDLRREHGHAGVALRDDRPQATAYDGIHRRLAELRNDLLGEAL